MANLLIRNATICEKDGNFRRVDILIRDGAIAGVYPLGLAISNGKKIDASGCFVFPGGIDPHIHSRFGEEHKEDIFSLSNAALRGGTTLGFDMPNDKPPTVDNLRMSFKAAYYKGIGDLKYWFGSDGFNLGEIKRASEQEYVVGVKLYLASDNLPGSDEKILKEIFRACAEKNLIIAVHAESKEMIERNLKSLGRKPNLTDHAFIRSKKAEITEVKRVIRLAKEFKAKIYFCHLSTPEAVRLVLEEKQNGLPFFIEVCPHHLILDKSFLERGNGKLSGGYFKVNPPLRKKRTAERLIPYIISGLAVDVIGSDHAPHTDTEKEKQEYGEIPSGLPGVDYRIPLMWQFVEEGWITPKRFEDLISGNAAKIFSLKDRGEIAVGKKADLFILDPSKELEIKGTFSKCSWTPYEGLRLQGDVAMTIKNGKVVYDGR